MKCDGKRLKFSKSAFFLDSGGNDVKNQKAVLKPGRSQASTRPFTSCIVYLTVGPSRVPPLRSLQQRVLRLQLRQLPPQAVHFALERFVVLDDVNHFVKGLVQTLRGAAPAQEHSCGDHRAKKKKKEALPVMTIILQQLGALRHYHNSIPIIASLRNNEERRADGLKKQNEHNTTFVTCKLSAGCGCRSPEARLSKTRLRGAAQRCATSQPARLEPSGRTEQSTVG